MKCHICHKTLQFIPDDPYMQPGEPSTWECPEMHAIIHLNRFNDAIIESYQIYWDGDQDAKERFKLTGQRTTHYTKGNLSLLYKRETYQLPSSYAKFPKWKLVLTLDHFFELQIMDGQIQADNLIPRLLRLRAFA
jgi:hypothetical protein